MVEEKKKNKTVIIIATILLLILVGLGVVMVVIPKPEEETKTEDNRCIDNICISKVSIEEVEGSKVVNVVLKNEGSKTVKNSCVNLVSGEKKYVICLNDAKANEELQLTLEYTEGAGETIEDYSLEKASKEEAEEANKKREEVLNNVK